MAAVVQASCPGCQSVLRIPADWADRTMRCKKCGAVVQGKKRSAPPAPRSPSEAETAPAAALPPAAYPYPLPPGYHPPGYGPAADDGAFPDPADTPEYRRGRKKYKRGGGNWFVGPVVVLVVVAGLVGGGMFLSRHIDKQRMANGEIPSKPPEPVATGETPKPGGLATAGTVFPRRMLFVHIANYIYFNPLSAGSSAGRDMPTKTAEKMAFELRVPNDKDQSQLTVLADTAGAKDFRPPLKATVMGAYEQFFATSRPQDRIVVYFGGHAVVADGKAYLAPVEGEPDDPATLIPLDDFYAKLKECKAQQKLVLFDVCRLDPDRGEEKPGGAKMSEELSKLLLAAPPGVRVATSCSANENAQESHETGSEFLTAFRVIAERTRRAGKQTAPKPDDPLPAGQWLDAMKAYLSEPRGKTTAQRVKADGTDPTTAVPFDKAAAPAGKVALTAPPVGASTDAVIDVLRQVSLPGIRADLTVPADLARVYPFPAEVMTAYAADGVTDAMIDAEPDKYPVRKAALDALRVVNKVWQTGTGGLMESFEGDVDDKIRKQIDDQQRLPAKINLELQEQIDATEAAAKKLKDEKSKRWRAVFQYARAQVLLRWAYMNEYDASLGKIKTDSLPRDDKGGRAGLKLVSVGKPSRKDSKEKVEAAKEVLEELATEHKGTPYEVIAKLHKYISVGLEWRVAVAEKMPDADAK